MRVHTKRNNARFGAHLDEVRFATEVVCKQEEVAADVAVVAVSERFAVTCWIPLLARV